MAWPFLERLIAVHTVTKANKDMAGIVTESGSDATEHTPQMRLEFAVKLLPDMRSEIACALAGLSVLAKPDADMIVGNCLTKWTARFCCRSSMWLSVHFENLLQTTYFNSINGLKCAIFKVIEPALAQVIRSGRAHRVFQAEMCRLIQTNAVADRIVNLGLFHTRFITQITKAVGQMGDRAIDENFLRKMEEASKQASDNEPSIKGSPPGATRLPNVPSNPEFHKEPGRTCHRRLKSSHCKCHGKLVLEGFHSISNT